jgi:hypothetical protein
VNLPNIIRTAAQAGSTFPAGIGSPQFIGGLPCPQPLVPLATNLCAMYKILSWTVSVSHNIVKRNLDKTNITCILWKFLNNYRPMEEYPTNVTPYIQNQSIQQKCISRNINTWSHIHIFT